MTQDLIGRYPHTHRMLTASGIYRRLNLAMAIPVLFGVYRAGSQALLVVLAALLTAILVDLTVSILAGRRSSGIDVGRSISIGLFTAAMTSVEAGPLFAATAAALGVLIGVWFVGGSGRYWLHPAMVGLAIAGTIMPERVADTNLAALSYQTGRIVGAFADFVGRLVFEPLAVRVPVEIWDRLTSLGAVPEAAIVAGAIPLILIASLIVYGEDLLPPVVPIVVFVSFVLVVRAHGGEPLTTLIDGTVLFAIVFGPAEPGVRPRSSVSIVLFGILLGALIALLSHDTEVAMPTIAAFLLAGSLVPLLSTIGSKIR